MEALLSDLHLLTFTHLLSSLSLNAACCPPHDCLHAFGLLWFFSLLVSWCCFVVSGSAEHWCPPLVVTATYIFLSSCCRNSLQKSLSALLIMTFFSHNQHSFFFDSWGKDMQLWSQWVSWLRRIFLEFSILVFPDLSLSACNLCVRRLLFVPPYRFRSLQWDPSPVRSSRAPRHTQVRKMLLSTLHSSVTFTLKT